MRRNTDSSTPKRWGTHSGILMNKWGRVNFIVLPMIRIWCRTQCVRECGEIIFARCRTAKKNMPKVSVTAVGTNAAATSAMIKAGAENAATGENAVVVNSKKADVIVGPIGIVIADALLGEITPLMAKAVAQSPAKRILIPINHCDNIVVGVDDLSVGKLLQDVIKELQKVCEKIFE